MQFYLGDPDMQLCVKALSSILHNAWEIVREEPHLSQCVDNRCLGAAKTITKELEKWLDSVETMCAEETREELLPMAVIISTVERIDMVRCSTT